MSDKELISSNQMIVSVDELKEKGFLNTHNQQVTI